MIKIRKFEDLKLIKVDSECILENDIDCKGANLHNLLPLFKGSIDGNNHKIFNFKLDFKLKSDGANNAIFQNLFKAKIANISFENCTINDKNEPYNTKNSVLALEAENIILENVKISISTENLDTFVVYYGTDVKIKNCTFIINNKNCDNFIKNID